MIKCKEEILSACDNLQIEYGWFGGEGLRGGCGVEGLALDAKPNFEAW
jgi:hypothetical protein